MKPIIKVENLSKQYTIGGAKEPYSTFRESLINAARKPLNAIKRRNQENGDNKFWALKDINFEVMPGEVVGIIGRNGAGKSTLLKILSRITEPTKGRIELYGRVGSLLEVGTGFHPELTGRENIYLNGAILGMKREEISKKFDEIVDFAEVENFLNTAVKRYSSGMHVRLAFAVAAHLEPEILIIDEVLAVGDSKFQKKCLGKMQKIGSEGRTILFVSHNMAIIRQLCKSALLIDKGSLIERGHTDSIIGSYINLSEFSSDAKYISEYGIELVDIHLQDMEKKEITTSPYFGKDYKLNLKFKTKHPLSDAIIVIYVYDDIGNHISSICSIEEGENPFQFNNSIEVSCDLPELQLFPRNYNLSVIVRRSKDKNYFHADRCFSFEVQASIVGDAAWAYHKEHGIVRISENCKVTITE